MTPREWIMLASFVLTFLGGIVAAVAFIFTIRQEVAMLRSRIDSVPDWETKLDRMEARLDQKINSLSGQIKEMTNSINRQFMVCPSHHGLERSMPL